MTVKNIIEKKEAIYNFVAVLHKIVLHGISIQVDDLDNIHIFSLKDCEIPEKDAFALLKTQIELYKVGIKLNSINIWKIEFIDKDSKIHLGEYSYLRIPGSNPPQVIAELALDSNIFGNLTGDSKYFHEINNESNLFKEIFIDKNNVN